MGDTQQAAALRKNGLSPKQKKRSLTALADDDRVVGIWKEISSRLSMVGTCLGRYALWGGGGKEKGAGRMSLW